LVPNEYRPIALFGALTLPIVGASWGWVLEKYREGEVALQRLRAPYKATSTIHSAAELQDIYRQMVTLMVEDLGYHNAAILQCRNDGALALRALFGFDDEVVGALVVESRDSNASNKND